MGKNFFDAAIIELTNYADSGWRLAVESNTDATNKNRYIDFQDLMKDLRIYEPSTEPNVVTGTPNTLTLNMDSYRQAMFEPRLSVATRTINVNFDLVISNQTNGKLLSVVLSLTGTITIDMPSDVLVSNASSIGTWDDVAKELELATGTDDIIELQFLRDKTASKWLLKVSEVAA